MKIDKRLIKKLKTQKIKYVVILFLMSLSMVLFVAFQTSYGYMINEIPELQEIYDVEIVNFSTLYDLETDDIEELENDYDLLIEKRLKADIEQSAMINIRLFSITEKINKIMIKSGRIPLNDQEILLNSNFMQQNDILLGDDISIDGIFYNIVGSGIAIDYMNMKKTETDALTDFKNFGVGYLHYDSFKEIEETNEQYLVSGKKSELEDFKKNIDEQFTIIAWEERENNIRISTIVPNIDGSYKMGLMVSILLMIIGGTILMIILERDIKSESKIIGVLKAFGYRKRELLLHYLKLVVFITLIASIIGYLGGTAFAQPLISVQSTRFELPVFVIEFNIQLYFVAAGSMMAIVLLINVIGILKLVGVPPLVLILNNSNSTRKTKYISSVELFDFKKRFRIKIFFNNSTRLIVLSLAIIFSSILIFTGMGLSDSVDNFVMESKDSITYTHNYILNGYYQEDEIMEDQEEGESTVLRSLKYTYNDEEYSIFLQGIKGDSRYFPDDLVARDKNAIVISKSISEKYGLEKGDIIKLEDNMTSRIYKWEITEIAEWYISDMVFVPIDKMYTAFDIPEDAINNIYSEEALSVDEDYILSINQKEDILVSMEAFQGVMNVMNYSIQAVACAMAIGIIYIIMLMVMEENKVNISMLKIMGYYHKEIRRIYLNINHIFVILAIIIGRLVVPVFITASIHEQNMVLNGFVRPHIYWRSTLIAALIVLITYILSNMILYRRIRRINGADLLRNRE